MIKILIIGVIIVLIVLVLSVLTINKGYSYKHSVDKPEANPYLTNKQEDQ
ncbi:YtzI protein [Bacillus cereus]|nr:MULTISPECIES: YtzI protein [unclassified Bacillus (in: firmicutes)]PFD96803.1 YtzI protein [Bacillus sp. AFS023182]PGY01590.1 YtzI protein [Bacillus cereus]SDY61472.1 Tumour necrosis factor receptor superfamily member 19 [Bacillus sp. 166amftsu]